MDSFTRLADDQQNFTKNFGGNDVVITNIGLKQTREKFLKDGIALEVVPKDEKDFGVINDLGQRDAIIYYIFISLR